MAEAPPTLLRGVQLLEGPGLPPRRADVRIEAGRLRSVAEPGSEAVSDSSEPGLRVLEAGRLWLAPPLVDPHSVLEDPLQGRAETLASLAAAAASEGYGTVALLPWGSPWRDRPATLDLQWREPLRLHGWGSFSRGGCDQELADHDDQLSAGAVGLAAGAALPPLSLLERGLRLAEMGDRPVLLAPRDPSLSQQGFVRERVEALRAGWPVDPAVSETLPLESLLALAAALPGAPLRLMNLSTAEAVQRLGALERPPAASVCWWHLLADSSRLDPAAGGWRLEPSLGGPEDREALIEALERGLITAIAVHHQALDAEEMLLSLEQRRAGIAGHGLEAAGHGGILASLWRELVGLRGWPPELLWQRLCWGPAAFLGLEPERLVSGSRRWILFDPEAKPRQEGPTSLAANHPAPPGGASGAIVASGLRGTSGWWAPEAPSC